MSYEITLHVRVYDPSALHAAALAHAIKVDEMDETHARSLIGPADEPDVSACLTILFDPGVSPDGCTIQGSTVESCMDFDDEDDGQPDEAQEWHDFDPDC